ncbi:MAG: endonuclease V [Candidatus Zixiibacteriota bacterium]
MKINKIHDWNITFKKAAGIQRELARAVVTTGTPKNVELIGGVDMAYDKATDQAFASLVILEYPSLKVIEVICRAGIISLPYVSGYLSFREAPLILDMLEHLDDLANVGEIDLLYIDGQGIAHPRGLGLASHIGLFLDIPVIGCAKSRLVGYFEEPGPEKGDYSKLWYKDKVVGNVLRTRDNTKPIFVSPGNRISIEQARIWTLNVSRKYKIPVPTRLADKEVAKFKKRVLP